MGNARWRHEKYAIGAFGFTAVTPSLISATEYTLIQLVFDVSGSAHAYQQSMEHLVKEIVGSCCRSERKHNFMLRVVASGTHPVEVHGFKFITDCDPADYDGVLCCGGCTALYDSTLDGIEAVANFSHILMQNDYLANGIVIVLTDGEDNASTLSPSNVKKALGKATQDDDLESLTSILIGVVGVGDPQSVVYRNMSESLERFYKEVGFTQYMKLDVLNEPTLVRMTDFVCRSIHAVSHALGSGGVS